MGWLTPKAAITLKHVKIKKTLLWSGAYRNSLMVFWAVPFPTPYIRSPLPLDCGSQPLRQNPKLQLLLSQELMKLRTSNLAATFTWFVWTKRPLWILEKRERGCIQGLRKFFGYPVYVTNGWTYRLQFWHVHLQDASEQKPSEILEKSECGHIQGLAKFFTYP